MAGKTRVKILTEHVNPFWMLVDREESPLIINIQEKIQQRLDKVNVTNLFLDGCLLPSDETSELLRDDDLVHVSVSESTGQPDVNTSPHQKRHRKRKHSSVSESTGQPDVNASPHQKRHRKRKHSSESDVKTVSDNQTSHVPVKLTPSDTKKKFKRKKEKKEKTAGGSEVQKLKENHKKKTAADQIEDNSKRVGKKTAADQIEDDSKSVQKKTAADQIEDNNDSVPSTHGLSTPISEDKICKTWNQGETETFEMRGKASEVQGITNTSSSTASPKDICLPVNRHRRKRRHRSKKACQPEENAAKPLTSVEKTPVEFRVPKWQKNQNKKTIFSSEESADEGRYDASKNQVDNQEVFDKLQDAVTSQASVQLDISDYNSSISECFLPCSLNRSEGSHVQREVRNDVTLTDDVIRSSPGTKSASIELAPDMNMAADVNGSVSVNETSESVKHINEMNGEGEWYRDQQFQEKLAEEKNQKRQCPSAVNKSVTPVLLYTAGHREVAQPDLAEHLKMSPEERGATVPPYVTARRLSNGAMLYSRAAVAARPGLTPVSSPFKKPTSTPPKASPHVLSKQQQLETISTNRSIIVQNLRCSGANTDAKENEDARKVNPPADRKSLPDDQETIVLTPFRREYSLFADLTAAPKVGDHIAYKVLEMGEDYTPGISDFKEAEVLQYDASTQNVTVKILHLCKTKKKTPGKFDIQEENPPDEEVTLELSSMFEPKLISTN